MEPGVADEIRALRVVMARLLLEEEDLSKLVAGIARLTATIVQAMRLQRLIDAGGGDAFEAAMNQVKDEWDRPQLAASEVETVR